MIDRGIRGPLFALGAAAAAALLAARPAPVHADARAPGSPNAGLAYGVTAAELATVGVFYLNFGTDLLPNHGPGLAFNFAPMVLGPATGYLARDADPTAALAVHGAGWVGLELFLLGTLIDGRDEKDRMKIGPTAITLGAIGAVGGGYLSMKYLDTSDDSAAALAAAPLGFAAGGVVLGGVYVLATGIDGDRALSQFTTGAIAGLSLGLAFATYLAVTDELPRSAELAGKLTPTVEPGPRRFMVSFGGRF